MTDIVVIYVLPTDDGMPPQAQLSNPATGAAIVVTWSRDQGAWLAPNGVQVTDDVGEAITEHAKELGVEW